VSSQREQRIWKLYQWVVIVAGAAAAVLVSVLFSQRINQQRDIWLFLGILPLYVIFDLIRLPYGDQVLSLGFPVVLFALLGCGENGPLITAGIVVWGSLCSECLYRLLVRDKPLAGFRFDRVAFYAAHHALSALAAMAAFDRVRAWQISRLPTETMRPFLEPSYLLVAVAYVLAYALVSWILVLLYDRKIQDLRSEKDESRLPRVHPVGSAMLMAPVPIAFGIFLFALDWLGQLIFSVVFLPVFLFFLVIAQSYAKVEQKAISSENREKARQDLLRLTRLDEEFVSRVSALVDRLLTRPGSCQIAVYSRSQGSDSLSLRGERWFDQDSRQEVRDYEALATPNGSTSLAVSRTWPSSIKPDIGVLGRALESGSVHFGLVSEAASEDSENDPRLPPRTAYLYVPLQFRGEVIGLMALARPHRRFIKPDRDDLAALTDALAERLISIQSIERRVEASYHQVEDYVRERARVREALEDLVRRGIPQIQMNEILSEIPERAFEKRFKETLEAFAEGRSSDIVSSLEDEDLTTIYDEVRRKAMVKMPPPDRILEDLRVIASSLRIGFGLRRPLSSEDWSEKYVPLYRACRSALDVRTTNDIVGKRHEALEAVERLPTESTPGAVFSALRQLDFAVNTLEKAHSEPFNRGQERLREAVHELDAVNEIVDRIEVAPLRLILLSWAGRWTDVVSDELTVEGSEVAELRLALRSSRALCLEDVDILLEVHNSGPGDATRVVAELSSNWAEYEIVGDRHVDLETLQVHQVKGAEFVVKPHRTDRLQLRFQAKYRDWQDAREAKQGFEPILSLEKELPRYCGRIPNPYVVGPRLERGSDLFVGRDDVFEFIRRGLRARQSHALVVVGERQAGKTSIANHLPERLDDEGYIHCYFNPEPVEDQRQFYHHLAVSINEGFAAAHIEMDRPASSEFSNYAKDVLESRFLPEALRRAGNRRLLISVDEYESLQRLKNPEDPSIIASLRSLIQRNHQIAFVFFGSHRMQEMDADYWYPLISVAKYTRVSHLSPTDDPEQDPALQLIRKPVEGYIIHDGLAVEEILRDTGRYPYLIQMVCSALVDSCNRNEESWVTLKRVRDVVREVVIETWRPYFQEWWEVEMSEEERIVLALLTEHLEAGELGTTQAIARRAQHVEPKLESDAVHRTLRRLTTRGTLTNPEGALIYGFAANLYRQFIKEEHYLPR
jgi:hypothetical protein